MPSNRPRADYFEQSRTILADPSTPYVLRNRIVCDDERDPVDCLHDAEVLMRFARMRIAENERAARKYNPRWKLSEAIEQAKTSDKNNGNGT